MNSFPNDFFIIIPARNEEETLPSLLHELTTSITKNIVVVDNNSSDKTFSIAQTFTMHVVKEIRPGYGNACLAGINYINNLPRRPSLVCFFDGDGQSLISDIIKVIAPLQQSRKINYCQGTRMITQSSKQSLNGSAYVANKVFSFLLSAIWHQKLTDLGPLRCIRLNLLNDLQMTSKSFAWTIEMNTKLLKKREVIIEIPVQYKIRSFGKSKISGSFKTSLKAATSMSLMFMKTAFFWRIKQ